MKGNKNTKTRAIEVIVAIIVVWMLVVGISIVVSFDEVAERNREMTELEWTYIVDTAYDSVEDIKAIEDSDLFIFDEGRNYYNIYDEKGKIVIAGPFKEVEDIGGGFVRTVYDPPGVVIEDENGNNIRTQIDELDVRGDGGKYEVIDYGRVLGIAKVKGR